MKTNSLESFGYKNCIAFENAVTRVGLCPQVGGHVLDYSPDGVNALDHIRRKRSKQMTKQWMMGIVVIQFRSPPHANRLTLLSSGQSHSASHK